MRGGKYRKLVNIEQPARAPDGAGEMLPSWSVFAGGLYAEINPLTGNEKIQAQQINASVTDMVKMRYLPGVIPQMRIIYGTRTLQIANVQNAMERDRELEILCIEEQ